MIMQNSFPCDEVIFLLYIKDAQMWLFWNIMKYTSNICKNLHKKISIHFEDLFIYFIIEKFIQFPYKLPPLEIIQKITNKWNLWCKTYRRIPTKRDNNTLNIWCEDPPFSVVVGRLGAERLGPRQIGPGTIVVWPMKLQYEIYIIIGYDTITHITLNWHSPFERSHIWHYALTHFLWHFLSHC